MQNAFFVRLAPGRGQSANELRLQLSFPCMAPNYFWWCTSDPDRRRDNGIAERETMHARRIIKNARGESEETFSASPQLQLRARGSGNSSSRRLKIEISRCSQSEVCKKCTRVFSPLPRATTAEAKKRFQCIGTVCSSSFKAQKSRSKLLSMRKRDRRWKWRWAAIPRFHHLHPRTAAAPLARVASYYVCLRVDVGVGTCAGLPALFIKWLIFLAE